jgi:DNA polymerase III epsilon subunit-like protein
MIILDIETSGLDERENCMLSLGAVELEDPTQEFYEECRVYSDRLIYDAALAINGFTYAQANDRSKQLPHDVVIHFLEWAKQRKHGLLLGGQQVGSFDIKFLKEIFDNNIAPTGEKWPFGYRSVDLHSLAWVKWRESLSLDGILVKLGLAPETKPHNALTGAKLEAEAFKRLLA